MHRREETCVVHHSKSLSIFAVAFVRIVLPFPGRVIGVGNFEWDVERPEYVSYPTHLRASLKKNNLNIFLILDEQVMHDLFTCTDGFNFTF